MKKQFLASALASTMLAAQALPGALYAQSYKGKQTLNDACWTISFEDNFDELSLWDETLDASHADQGIWRTQYIWPRDIIINNEEQFYIDPRQVNLSPFSISNSILKITAQRTPKELLPYVTDQPYVSGVLTSQKSFSQKYGRFEVSAKVPEGKGLWSAFWLLPTFDSWPEGIAILHEIDVMEHLGHQPNVYHTTLHTNQTGELTSHPYDHTETHALTTDFHRYTVVWTPESVNWYLDGQWRAAHPTPDDYTQPVHFLLNLAVGGSWPGSPDNTTTFPAHYEIDYVRAYTANEQCDG